MSAYECILKDLRTMTPEGTLSYPPPYDAQSSLEEKFTSLQEAINRSKRLGHQALQLVNLFYMGQFLEKEVTTSPQRSLYAQQLSDHYRIISLRMYYIFEPFGAHQIAQITQTTPTMVRKLSQREYQDLVVKSIEIFNGVEN